MEDPPPKADLWIQAASVGEAHLACQILQNLKPAAPLRVLLTTYTKQGLETLQSCCTDVSQKHEMLAVSTAYFPFDKPSLMAKALRCIQPQLIVLLESELWPGLLSLCQKENRKVLVVNGRMTQKSLSRYVLWPTLWKNIKPTKILAMSQEDLDRFANLFGQECVEIMNNIKFDRITSTAGQERTNNPLRAVLSPERPFVVLGSVRQEEEAEISYIIDEITSRNQDIIVGLFPRHMHRLEFWKKTLSEKSASWQIRSEVTKPVQEGCIILWDTMGELSHAYDLANAAFVGGSLAPLGGQNFLEPLTCGIRPVIGPHWSNFYWIGKEIIELKFVLQVKTWQEAGQLLLEQVTRKRDRQGTREAVNHYLRSRQGGTQKACDTINGYLTL